MTRHLLIDVGLFETRAAILEQGRLTDLAYYRRDQGAGVGEIYLGRVTSFAKGLDAAFIDLGAAGDGFLLGRDTPSPDKKAPISKKLHEGQKLILQITKDTKGEKGYQLSGFPKLQSAHLVYNPQASGLVFAKSLKDAALKADISNTLEDVLSSATGGVTVRSKVSKVSVPLLGNELLQLRETWQEIEHTGALENKVRCLLPKDPPVLAAFKNYAEANTPLYVNDRDGFDVLKTFLKNQGPGKNPLSLWPENDLLFDAFEVEEQIEAAMEVRVPLPSGGTIVIEQTEALVAIDVNSGGQIETRNPSTVAFSTNLEAAKVICQQIRLRNLSGIIIVDFIQMQEKGAVEQLTARLKDNTRNDPSLVRVVGMTTLGLMQLTRQRKESSLRDLHAAPLDTGSSTLPTHVASRLIRDINRYARSQKTPNISLKIGSRLVPLFKSRGREIENHLNLNIVWEEDAVLHIHAYQIR